MSDDEGTELESLTLDKKTIEVMVAHVIPTSKYFEVRFDHMQGQMDRMNSDIKDFRGDVDKKFDAVKSDMDQRFSRVDKKFGDVKSDMDKRFDQVDKRFEQVDKRLEQIIASIDRLGDKLDHRDENQRGFTLRMFTIAIGISVIGALGTFLKSLGLF